MEMNRKHLVMQKKNSQINREYLELHPFLRGMPRSADQINSFFEADCEILKLGGQYLAVSSDSVGEEIDLKIYQDPFLWGWMTVMNSVSDLAASGTEALGLVLSNQWKYGTSKAVKARFFLGVKKALGMSKVPLLGGDSGNGEAHCHTSTILGLSKKIKPLTRIGIKEGDILCLLGKNQTGNGPAIALRILFKKSESAFAEKYFRPVPSIKKMSLLRPLLQAAIDTSDGIAVSLQILSELNQVGFKVVWNEKTLSSHALRFCKKTDLHPLLLWMSDLGDLQTLVAIPKTKLSKALMLEPALLPIASATSKENGITLQYQDKIINLPTEAIANCPRNIRSIRSTIKKLNLIFKKEIPV